MSLTGQRVFKDLLMLGACAAWVAMSPANAAVSCSTIISPFGFGNFDPDGATADSDSGYVRVNCSVVGNSQPTPTSQDYTISIGPGSSGNYASRKLQQGAGGPGNQLFYNLFVSASRLPGQVWGDGSSGTMLVGGTISNLSNATPTGSRDHTIYGRVPAPQSGLNPGVYSDTMLVTVTY